jgi:lysophospholipase L1-like esterase
MKHIIAIATATTFATSTSAQPLPLSLNLEAAYADTRAASLAGDADIVCIGDSLTFRIDSYLPVLRNRMQSKYGDGGIGYRSALPGDFLVYSNTTLNEWWFGSLGPGSPPYMALDGLWSLANEPSNARARSFYARFRLHVLATPSGGPWLASDDSLRFASIVDGHAPIPTFRAVDISNPLGTQVRLSPTNVRPTYDEEIGPVARPEPPGESITILGGVIRSASPGVRLHRVANGGWGVTNYTRRDFTFDAQLRDLNADLYIVMLGQNDLLTPPALWRVQYAELIDRLRAASPSAEFILVASYDSGLPQSGDLARVVHDLAAERELGFINLYTAGGPYQRYIDANLLSDPIHFNQAGGQYVGNLLYDAIESAGASLVADCNDIDFNNNNVFPEDQDVIDYFNVLAGGECRTVQLGEPGCDSIDFNRNGVFPEDQDVIDFFNVLAGAPCP